MSSDQRLPNRVSRRNLLLGSAAAASAMVATSLPGGAEAAQAAKGASASSAWQAATGSYITARDGTQLYYKDWGSGRPVVFSHGWPLQLR